MTCYSIGKEWNTIIPTLLSCIIIRLTSVTCHHSLDLSPLSGEDTGYKILDDSKHFEFLPPTSIALRLRRHSENHPSFDDSRSFINGAPSSDPSFLHPAADLPLLNRNV